MIVPVYNVRAWIGPAMDSLLSQSLRDMEIIVVDDGSTDGSADLVRRYAHVDDRIRVITKKNAGLGAARNTGLEYATGEFIAFFDSDDLLMPGAYEAMVNRLRETGSEFVTAAFARGDETAAIKPAWVSRCMARDRTCLTIIDEPWLLLDITAWNKVFRRSFWTRHHLEFVEGVRYEDQVPISTAYLKAQSFDVLRQRVYLWRTRMDGTSITQQKASISDLGDRLRSQEECAQLFRKAPEPIREMWYLKLLDFDLPGYLEAALNADTEYVALLLESLARLRRDVPKGVWERVAFPNRATSWALSHGRMDLGRELRIWFQRDLFGLQTEVVDEVLVYRPPFAVSEQDLPLHLRRAHEVDIRPVIRLTEVLWEGSTLTLRGSAYLTPLAADCGTHVLSLDLLEASGARHPVEVTRFSDPRLDVLAKRSYTNMTDTGFEARIEAERLARNVAPGQQSLRLEFTQSQGAHERRSDITHVSNGGSGAARQPRLCAGRMVRLAGVLDRGHRILVQDAFAWSSSARIADPDALELTLCTPAADPVESAHLAPSRPGDEPIPVVTSESGVTRVEVRPDTGRRLVVGLRSGIQTDVLWDDEPNVVGHPVTGGFVHRGVAQVVTVDERKPAISVHSVVPSHEGVLVHGTSLGAEGQRLFLSGLRSNGSRSEPLPEGPFEILVPARQDPWGRSEAALPADTYRLAAASAKDRRPSDEQCYVFAATPLRDLCPVEFDAGDQHLSIEVRDLFELQVTTSALSPEDSSPRRQAVLRSEAYAAARGADRRDAVLLESFGGQTTGDSPAAIAEELIRRNTGLDLVWSRIDGSIPAPAGTRVVHRMSAEWWDLLGSARYLVNNAHFPFFFEKAPGQIYLQTWHGTPLKKIAADIADKRFFSVSYLRTMDREAEAWDFLISPSPFCTKIFPRAFGYSGPVIESGYPRNDALVRADADERGREVRRSLGIADHQRVVLYAPTWRDSSRTIASYSKVLHLEPQQLLDELPDIVLLVRGHANTALAEAVHHDIGGRVVDVTLYPDINDLFLASHALVTDYSSVMFDYCLLDRPMMFLVPDLVDYRDRVRGFYFDFEAIAPGPFLADQDELVAHLRALPQSDDGVHRTSRGVPQQFAPFDDGSAAARVVDRVITETSH